MVATPWLTLALGLATFLCAAKSHGRQVRHPSPREGAITLRAKDKVLVVTGGGSGMGRELVLELLRRGAHVAAIDLNSKSLEETAAHAGNERASLATFVGDVSDLSAVESLVQAISDRFRVVDGVINCAGIIQPFVRLKDLEYAAIERVFRVNWLGTLYVTKAFLPALLQRPEAHVVNISSMGGFLPVPGQTVYGASKAAVKLLTEGLHSELADTNVRVTIVFPGAIATNIAANSGVTISIGVDQAKFKMLSAERAARDILDGMERNAFRVLVGADAKVLDKLYRLAPQRAAAFIANQMKQLLK